MVVARSPPQLVVVLMPAQERPQPSGPNGSVPYRPNVSPQKHDVPDWKKKTLVCQRWEKTRVGSTDKAIAFGAQMGQLIDAVSFLSLELLYPDNSGNTVNHVLRCDLLSHVQQFHLKIK